MKSCKERLATFANWPKPQIDPQRLVNAGFYYLKEDDKVCCAWCKGVLGAWNPSDVPFDEHAKYYERCPFILNPPPYAFHGEDECGRRQRRNVAPAAVPEGAVPHPGPKHTNMVSPLTRMKTFSSAQWLATAEVDPKDLVEAGFFYIGVGDFTKCFHCDGGLRDWSEGDDPWVEHARWYPECSLVRLKKGDAFIEQCKIIHQQLMHEADLLATESIGDRSVADKFQNELEVWLASPIVKFYMVKGVPLTHIRRTIENLMIDRGKGFESSRELTEILSEQLTLPKDSAKVEKREEGPSSNTRQKLDRILCIVCMDEDRSVLFLPCRHLVTCPSCAVSVTECVACREPIQSSMQTFYS